MPTARFYRLKKEKKRNISQAVIDEFQHTSYQSMCISRIAKNARVSRGSLYAYFYNKEDMFIFALHDIWKSALEYDKAVMTEKEGDYWEMVRCSMTERLNLCQTNEMFRCLYMLPENNGLKSIPGERKKRKREMDAYKRWMFEHLDKEKVCCGLEDFLIVQDICQSLILVSVHQSLFCTATQEEIKGEFERKLTQIQSKYSR